MVSSPLGPPHTATKRVHPSFRRETSKCFFFSHAQASLNVQIFQEPHLHILFFIQSFRYLSPQFGNLNFNLFRGSFFWVCFQPFKSHKSSERSKWVSASKIFRLELPTWSWTSFFIWAWPKLGRFEGSWKNRKCVLESSNAKLCGRVQEFL